MLSVYRELVSEFGIASSSFTYVLFFVCWANDYVNEVPTVTCHFRFIEICLTVFLNVYETFSSWKPRHLLSEHLKTLAILFVNKWFVKICFRFGGCRFAWINLMFLKPLTSFSTSVFTAGFTKLYILGLFGLKVLLKVKLLLFSVVLGRCITVWGFFNGLYIQISTTFSE